MHVGMIRHTGWWAPGLCLGYPNNGLRLGRQLKLKLLPKELLQHIRWIPGFMWGAVMGSFLHQKENFFTLCDPHHDVYLNIYSIYSDKLSDVYSDILSGII